MKKFFAALSCCLMMASSSIAQDVQSVIEAPDSEVVLASAQDTPPATPPAAAPASTTTAAPTAPAVQEPAPAPVAAPATEVQSSAMDINAPVHAGTVEGAAPMIEGAAPVANSGCGCGPTVQSFAAPQDYSAPVSVAAPMSSGCGCGTPAPVATGCGCAQPAPVANCSQPRRSFHRPYVVNRVMGRRCCN